MSLLGQISILQDLFGYVGFHGSAELARILRISALNTEEALRPISTSDRRKQSAKDP